MTPTYSQDHKFAAFKAKSSVNSCRQNEPSVLEFGSNAYRDKVKKNREILTSIVGAVVVCGRQKIALRGKKEDRRNVKVHVVLKYTAAKDDLLREHLTSAPKHAKYLSPKMQNEFINLCGTRISNTITERCPPAQYFTIMADESANVSIIDQFAFCTDARRNLFLIIILLQKNPCLLYRRRAQQENHSMHF